MDRAFENAARARSGQTYEALFKHCGPDGRIDNRSFPPPATHRMEARAAKYAAEEAADPYRLVSQEVGGPDAVKYPDFAPVAPEDTKPIPSCGIRRCSLVLY